jgi:hypothetical protein
MSKLKSFDVVREKWLSPQSISTLKKIAVALNCDLKIGFLPKKMSHAEG